MVTVDHLKPRALAAGLVQNAIIFVAGMAMAHVVRIARPRAAFATVEDLNDVTSRAHGRIARLEQRITHIEESTAGRIGLVADELAAYRDQVG